MPTKTHYVVSLKLERVNLTTPESRNHAVPTEETRAVAEMASVHMRGTDLSQLVSAAVGSLNIAAELQNTEV